MLGNEEIEKIYLANKTCLIQMAQTILGLDYFDEAEDIVQEAFCELCRRRDAKNPSAWIYRVVEYMCWDYLSQKALCTGLENVDFKDVEDALFDLSPAVQAAMDGMPDHLDDIWLKYWVEGMTQKDIAEFYGCTERTIWNRLDEARSYLRKKIQRYVDSA